MRLPVIPALAGCLFCLVSCGTDPGSPEGPPNILFILADDQSSQTLIEPWAREVHTPSLDAIARRGVSFTAAYNMGGWHGAICVASRTMFNTGRTLWNARESEPFLDSLSEAGELWSQKLESLGYETYFTGKWHVGVDPHRLFMHVGTVRGGMPRQTEQGYHRPQDEKDRRWTPWDSAFGGFWEGGTHWSEVVARETLSFIDTASRSERPFFMYIAFNAPHDPRQSPRPFVEQYPPEKVPLPGNYLPQYPYMEEIGCGPSLRDEMLAPFPRTPFAVRVHRGEYYALITHLDTQVGRILDRLESTGMDSNTLVIFAADHGLSVGQHGLMGKQNMYDHSLCAPLLISGPGIPSGEHRDVPVYLQDVVPTVMELASGEVPPSSEFQSLLPLLGKGAGKERSSVYGAYRHLQRMVRLDSFKLILYPEAGKLRLYNLAEDPEETRDLSDLPGYEDRIRTLFGELELLQKELGDTLNLQRFVFQ